MAGPSPFVDTSPLQVVIAGGSASVRHAVAEELQRSSRISVVGVLDQLDDTPMDGRSRLVVLDVGGDRPIEGVLSSREIDVLRCLGRGLTNAGIAGELYVSTETVKTHVRNVMRKLGVSDRGAAVERAVEAGLLTREKPAASWTESDTAGPSHWAAERSSGPR
jgi:ATP/maltotriose-dependent transcriptional regulator MalT